MFSSKKKKKKRSVKFNDHRNRKIKNMFPMFGSKRNDLNRRKTSKILYK